MAKLELESFRMKEKAIEGKPKLLVLVSGGGTNLQEIINRNETGGIDVEIVGVISDNADAYGLVRAQSHNIPIAVVSSKGRKKDPIERANFEKELFCEIERFSPDMVVLAGWMMILGDDFIGKAQRLEIPIINLHPALLTQGNDDKVMTSRGEISVIRGAHAIGDAYNLNLPVSGVTVHQVVPGPFDTGPIILQEEVLRKEDDTLEKWEKRIHQVEYRLLPDAIRFVALVMRYGIDVSNCNFPWRNLWEWV